MGESKTILIIASVSRSLINFRGDLLKLLVKRGYKVIVAAGDSNEEILNKLALLSIPYHKYKINRKGKNILSDLQTFYSLIKLIKQVKPDILLTYTIKPVIYGSIAAKLLNIKNINALITGLGETFYNSKNKFIKTITLCLYGLSFKSINSVIFQNPDDLNELLKRKIVTKEQSFRVYGSGVNLSLFKPSPLPKDKIVFLFVGRLLKEKGILDFITAAKIIKPINTDVEFHIVGQLPTNSSYLTEEDLNYLENEDLIKYFGNVKDVRPYIEEASVFVLPSYYGEGTPRSALEAMAMGRPIITTDSVGCKETVNNGYNGYLVPIKSPSDIVKVMNKFIDDRKLLEVMAQNSIAFAQQFYDVNKVNREMLKIIETTV